MRHISLFLAAAALVVVAIPAQATPAIMKTAQAAKKDEIKNCASCHIGTPKDKKLTPVGLKYKK